MALLRQGNLWVTGVDPGSTESEAVRRVRDHEGLKRAARLQAGEMDPAHPYSPNTYRHTHTHIYTYIHKTHTHSSSSRSSTPPARFPALIPEMPRYMGRLQAVERPHGPVPNHFFQQTGLFCVPSSSSIARTVPTPRSRGHSGCIILPPQLGL